MSVGEGDVFHIDPRVFVATHRPVPDGGGTKRFMSNGDRIPSVTLACDVCRIPLCKNCFYHVHDHRGSSYPVESLYVR